MFFDLKNMLNFNFYFFKFCKKTKNKILKTKVVKQKLKKIFKHVFKFKKHVVVKTLMLKICFNMMNKKFLKIYKHVEIILIKITTTCRNRVLHWWICRDMFNFNFIKTNRTNQN